MLLSFGAFIFDLLPAKLMSVMEISVFDEDEDAYWWILCTEKFFAAKGTQESEKMTAIVPAMSGRALHWWRWWYPRHPQVSWDSFTVAFLGDLGQNIETFYRCPIRSKSRSGFPNS